MSNTRIELHPAHQALLGEVALLREELAHLLAEEHDLLHTVRQNLLALWQQKIGAWELTRLHAQVAALRARRRLELAQAAVNHARAPDWAAIDGQLELELLGWQQKLKEAAEQLGAAEQRLQHLLPSAEAGELKKLYRALVKKLHPDLNPQLTEDQRRLWHRVRLAYECSDLMELRALTLLAQEPRDAEPGFDALDALQRDRETLRRQIAEMLRRLEKIESAPPFTLRAQLADEAWVAARREEIETEIARFEVQHAAFDAALEPLLSSPDDGKFGPN